MDIFSQLRRDEELRLHAYPDPLTGARPWTIGYGSTGPEITQDTVWTLDQAEAALHARVGYLFQELSHRFPWFSLLSEARRGVLLNMAYQQGLEGLIGYSRMLTALAVEDYPTAKREMLDSLWAKQTPARAERLAEQLISGNWQ